MKHLSRLFLLAWACLLAAGAYGQSQPEVRIRLLTLGEMPQELYYLTGKEVQTVAVSSNQFSEAFSYRGNPTFALFVSKPVFGNGGQLLTSPLATLKLPSGVRDFVLVLYTAPDGKYRLQAAPIPQTGSQLCVINTVPAPIGMTIDEEPVKLGPNGVELVPLTFTPDATQRQRIAVKLYAQDSAGEWKLLRSSGTQLKTRSQPFMLIYAPSEKAGPNENMVNWSVFYRPAY